MSTYTDPYVYGEIAGQASNTAELRNTQMGLIKNWFVEAGWSAYEQPARLVVHTTSVTNFQACLLGPSNDIFYQVGFDDTGSDYMVIDKDSGCCDPPDTSDEDEGKVYWEGGYNAILGGLTPKDPPKVNWKRKSTGCSNANYKVVQSTGTITDIQATHAAIKSILLVILTNRLGDYNLIDYGTESDGGSGFKTTFGLLGGTSPRTWTTTTGGQLATTHTAITGSGYLLVGEDNTVTDNHMEMTMYYEVSPPSTVNNSNQIRFVTRVGSRFSESYDHYEDIYDDEVGDTVGTKGGLTAVDQIEGYISPTCFFLDQPSLGTINCSVWGGAFRLKALEGETGTPNITKAIFLGATVQRSTKPLDSFRETNTALPNSTFWVEAADTPARSWYTGSYNISHMGYMSSRSLSNERDGMFWYGDLIASICEPWIGWNAFIDINGGDSPATPAPVFCQIPDCIVPWRSLSHGEPPTTDDIFTWDGKLWRYYQTNRYPENDSFNGPGASLALRVSDSRIYNGSGYSGLEMYDLESVSISPTSIVAGSTSTVTVTAKGTQNLSNGGMCIIRSNNERLQFNSNIVTFAPGSITATVDVTENSLGILQTVQLQAIGVNDSIVVENVAALA